MENEFKRMQELAGTPANEEKESLNEHYVAGGIVGVGAINQIPPREKSDYEMAFEHFMNEGKEEEVEEVMDPEVEITGTDIDDINVSPSIPDFGDDEITGTDIDDLNLEEDNPIEEGTNVGYEAAKKALASLKSMEDKEDFKDYVSNVDLTRM